MTRLHRWSRLISTGSGTLWSRYTTWAWPGQAKPFLARLAAVACAGWFLTGMVLAEPGLMWLLAAGWLTAAWRQGRAIDRQEQAEAGFVQLLADAIGDHNGVLLADVLTLLHRDELLTEWTVTDVRAQCEALDIPVRDKIKVNGAVSIGVHIDDLNAVWVVDPTPAPPNPSRDRHAAVTSDNYPTTPEGAPLSEEVTCTPQQSAEPVDDGFEDHLADALHVLDDTAEEVSKP